MEEDGEASRERLVVGIALFMLALLAWAYLIWVSQQMQADMSDMTGMAGMSGMDMSGMTMAPSPWSLAHFLFILAMWTVMMVGMMTPSASPTILIYARVAGDAARQGVVFASTAWFAGGYLLAWSIFSLLAASAQYLMDRALLLSPAMALNDHYAAAALLAAAGLYQLTPVKRACLANCRAPISFIQRHGGFKPGASAALKLGLLHGLYCVGCCWILMALLFVGGVMSPLWIAGLMVFVLIEKLAAPEPFISTLACIAALAAAVWVAFGP
jgi:predicted metal-binding membrane protein